MKVQVIGSSISSSQSMVCSRRELLYRDLRFLVDNNSTKVWYPRPSSVSFGWRWRPNISRTGIHLYIKAEQSTEPIRSSHLSCRSKSTKTDKVKLFVGLPLDSVSSCNTINHGRAITAGLKALKLLGVEGVELPIWWGIVEREKMGSYEWSSYLALTEMVQKAGLKLQISLCFHASNESKILLPEWVSRIGQSQPGLYFTDRSRQPYTECLSLGADDLPVFDGKTPIQVYQEFCESFKCTFSQFIGSTITGISIGLGPEGELRYPSHRQGAGVGEFQCYDPNMLGNLKQHAEALGNPLWGLDGPHDAPKYNQFPNSTPFFNEHGESWESTYGDFFLSWYSSKLISHGDRLLSMASSIFQDKDVTVHGKLPLIHSWYKTRSHPSELTAGFYNTAEKNGYEAIAEIFAKNSCEVILPGLDLSDKYQQTYSQSSPELLLAQITTSCQKHGVRVSGQNSSVSGVPGSFERIKENLSNGNSVKVFTYQRMGAYFFSPEHFPKFTELVRSLSQPALHADDLRADEEEVAERLPMSSKPSVVQMTAA